MLLPVNTNRPGRSALSTPALAPETSDLLEAVANADVAELGARIKASRQQRSMTQSHAAKGIISGAYLSRIESGERRPELKVLRALAERLETSVHEWLVGLTPKQWSERGVELDWAQLSLRTGDALGALTRLDSLQADLPPASRLYRRALYTRALALEATGDYEQAAITLENLVETEAEGPPALEALTALSRIYRLCGELGRAIEVGERADRRIVDLNMQGTPEQVKLTLTIAAAHCESGDVNYAARLCQRALKHAEVLKSPNERAGCYWNASIIEVERGNHAEAVALGQKAILILDEAESTRNSARLKTQMGLIRLRVNPPQVVEALEDLTGAEPELLASEASPADLSQNRLGQARARFLLGDLDGAEPLAEQARTLAENAPVQLAEAHVLSGRIRFARDDTPGAQDFYGRAILALTGVGADRNAAQIWYELGSLWRAVGCPDKALDAYERAAASTGIGMTYEDTLRQAGARATV